MSEIKRVLKKISVEGQSSNYWMLIFADGDKKTLEGVFQTYKEAAKFAKNGFPLLFCRYTSTFKKENPGCEFEYSFYKVFYLASARSSDKFFFKFV